MDTEGNTYFCVKKIRDGNRGECYVFFVIGNVPLSDEILQEMAKYEIVEFCDSFNQTVEFKRTHSFEHPLGDSLSPTDGLPCGLQSLTFGYEFNQPVNNLPLGLQSLTISKNYRKPLDNLPVSVEIIRY